MCNQIENLWPESEVSMLTEEASVKMRSNFVYQCVAEILLWHNQQTHKSQQENIIKKKKLSPLRYVYLALWKNITADSANDFL